MQLIFIAVLIFIFYQDLRYRAIHIILPVLVIIIAFFLLSLPFSLVIKNTLINGVFFLLIFGLMVIYMRVKNKNYSNPLQTYFGLGDVIFFLSVAPLFELKKYLVFIITSMFFSIILYFVFLKRKGTESIPLAGFSAFVLLFLLLVRSFLKPFTLLLF
ncbi:hypothetical protein Pf1_01758 [Flavobacterium columnare]|nr:hypothetical protein Pf1_01758 [Flavobacterium columnare]